MVVLHANQIPAGAMLRTVEIATCPEHTDSSDA